MFVDRQIILSYLLSLKFVTLSVEIRRFQAANIGKIEKTTTFLIKKVNFYCFFCRFLWSRGLFFGAENGYLRWRRLLRRPRSQRVSLNPSST